MSLFLHHDPVGPDVLRAALAGTEAAQTGLEGVLGSLNRQARLTAVPGRRVEWGLTWEDRDVQTPRWWPQGITTVGEAGDPAAAVGRPVVLTSWYAKGEDGGHEATRVTVLDLGTLRYRHVLLVQPRADGSGWSPLRVHAGGLAWSGGRLLVAATRRGLYLAELGGLLRVQHPEEFLGHRFVLPVTARLRADQAADVEPLRYSFCSIERSSTGALLHVGEYGRGSASRRLVRFDLDGDGGVLPPGEEASGPASAPVHRAVGTLLGEGPTTMQGVAVPDGRHHLTSSHGTRLPGTLHVGDTRRAVRGGDLRVRSHRGALPPGPEDLTWWPEQGLLWSLSEHPGARFVFALRPAR